MSTPLKHLTVLVTRPEHQAHNLCDQITAQGGHAILLPTLEISDATDQLDLHQKVQTLPNHDRALFVSPNAVTKTLPLVSRYFSRWPSAIKIITVGAGTAQKCQDYGLTVDFCPSQSFNSESVLALPALQNINKSKIILFRGEGGRELLATTLRNRGACITEVITYRRTLPKISRSSLPFLDKVDIIISTSNTGLQNLIEIIGPEGRSRLLNMSLLVISERMRVMAKTLGFNKKPLVADNASDLAIINALLRWQEIRHGNYSE